jgi:uncharacterized membrane protein YraQ (UPF0718 family)
VSDCCDHENSENSKRRFDWLLWGSLIVVVLAYIGQIAFHDRLAGVRFVGPFVQGTAELMNKMWWGLLIGIVAVSVLARVPRELVVGVLGKPGGISGILRATLAGLTLDLCNHGILLVGMQLYKRGASLGQTMAFLIASPWNSLSLTIILVSLIGLKWTVVFVLLSGLVAIVSGLIFEALVRLKRLPANPNSFDLPDDFRFWREVRESWKGAKFSPAYFGKMLRDGVGESRMILRWIFFGVVLAAAIRAGIPSNEMFAAWFGPTIGGLLLTLLAATVIEVCSEGSSPIAGDLLTRGGAPGNAFTFLMSGAATDYTEIISLKETTGSWKMALALPVVTVPQIVVIGWLLNGF